MSDAYLKLTIGDYTCRLERFVNSVLPRMLVGVGDPITYSAAGSVIVQGEAHDQFNIWNIDADITVEQYQALLIIYAESDYQRRHNGDPSITVVDTTASVADRGGRTRALAPGTSEITDGSYTLYYAQFKAVMQSFPEFRQFGKGYIAKFVLQETERVPA